MDGHETQSVCIKLQAFCVGRHSKADNLHDSNQR